MYEEFVDEQDCAYSDNGYNNNDEEQEDPLKIDSRLTNGDGEPHSGMESDSGQSSYGIPQNMLHYNVLPRIMKVEPSTDGSNFVNHDVDRSFENSSSSSFYNQELRSFTCKSCKQPYEVACSSNLIIKGFCTNCLNRDKVTKIVDNTVFIVNKPQDEVVKCDYCKTIFSDNKSLNEHLTVRYSLEYKCTICDEIFCDDIKLNEHTFTHGKSIINSVLPSKSYPDVMKSKRTNHKKSVVCSLCNKLILKALFNEHMKEHEDDTLNSMRNSISANKLGDTHLNMTCCQYEYVCELCSMSFVEFELLMAHIKSDEHKNMIVAISGMILMCKICKNVFSNLTDLVSHLNNPDHILKYHIKTKYLKIYDCSLCENVYFIKETDAIAHSVLCHNINVSEKCNDKAVEYGEVKNRINISRTSIVPKRVLKRNHSSNDEVKTVNENLKSLPKDPKITTEKTIYNEIFTCKICNVTYSDVDRYQQHIYRKHRTESEDVKRSINYKCKKCRVYFKSSQAFNKHVAKRHKNVDPNRDRNNETSTNRPKQMLKKYKCSTCKSIFDNEVSCKKHVTYKKHSGIVEFNSSDSNFKCPVCCLVVEDYTIYRKHCRSHNNANGSFKCLTCKKVFGELQCLKRHMKSVHLKLTTTNTLVKESKKYCCKYCGKEFEFCKKFSSHFRFCRMRPKTN